MTSTETVAILATRLNQFPPILKNNANRIAVTREDNGGDRSGRVCGLRSGGVFTLIRFDVHICHSKGEASQAFGKSTGPPSTGFRKRRFMEDWPHRWRCLTQPYFTIRLLTGITLWPLAPPSTSFLLHVATMCYFHIAYAKSHFVNISHCQSASYPVPLEPFSRFDYQMFICCLFIPVGISYLDSGARTL